MAAPVDYTTLRILSRRSVVYELSFGTSLVTVGCLGGGEQLLQTNRQNYATLYVDVGSTE